MPFVFLVDKDQFGNMLAPKDINTLVVCAGTIGDSVDGMGAGFSYFKKRFGFDNNPRPAWVATLNEELQKQKKNKSITPYIRLIESNSGYCGGVATVDIVARQSPSDAQKAQYKQAVTSAILDALALRKVLYLQPLGIGIYGWEPKLAAQLFNESYNELKKKDPSSINNLQIQIPIFDSSANSKDSIFKAELEALQKSEKSGMLMEGVEYNIKYKESGIALHSEELTDRLSIQASITFQQAEKIRVIICKYFRCDRKKLFLAIVCANSSVSDEEVSKRTVSISYPSELLSEEGLGNCLGEISSFLGKIKGNSLGQGGNSIPKIQAPISQKPRLSILGSKAGAAKTAPPQSQNNSTSFSNVKFLGDRRQNGNKREHQGTLCYEIECSVDEEKSHLVTLLQQKGIKILFNGRDRIKYGLRTNDGKKDAEKRVKELIIEQVTINKLVDQIASKCNDVDYWQTKVRPGYGASRGNYKIPHAISEIQQRLNEYKQNNIGGAALLESIGKLAEYKHSTYFQWAHSFFRGRDNQTNKYYGILARLKGELKAEDMSKIITDLDKEFAGENEIQAQISP